MKYLKDPVFTRSAISISILSFIVIGVILQQLNIAQGLGGILFMVGIVGSIWAIPAFYELQSGQSMSFLSGNTSNRNCYNCQQKLGGAEFRHQLRHGYAVCPNCSMKIPRLRVSDMKTLSMSNNPDSVEYLIVGLKHENWEIRTLSAEGLGGKADLRAVEPLITALQASINSGDQNEKWRARHKIAEALGKLSDNRAVPTLINSLTDKSFAVRVASADALGKIGDQRAIEPLKLALQNKNFSISREELGVASLLKIGSPESSATAALQLLEKNK